MENTFSITKESLKLTGRALTQAVNKMGETHDPLRRI